MLSDKDLDTIFRSARTHNAWQDRPVSDVTLQAIYDLMRWGPTSANSFPLRIVFVKSPEAKARLAPHLSEGNRAKTMQAPVTAILAWDTQFYDRLPELFPHNPGARDWFSGNAAHAEATAFRNSSLQGGYFIIAARALGLDCGPMSGFDNAGVDAAFFPDGRCRSNFICSLGHGAPEGLKPRGPRPDFDSVCRIV
jgi:3-hydroxypropanoate dehydrogenase